VLGAIAIFVYVGAEVSIGSFLVNYLNQPDIGDLSETLAARYVSLYWGGAMIGRFVGSALLRRVPTGTDASPSSSRMPTHGSRPMRIATPSLQWTFTTYSLPVSTGAPLCLINAHAAKWQEQQSTAPRRGFRCRARGHLFLPLAY
jgi:hypothetical protein